MFDKKFLDTLPEDYNSAFEMLCAEFMSFYNYDKDKKSNYDKYLSALGALKAFLESNNVNEEHPNISGDIDNDINIIHSFFYSLHEEHTIFLIEKQAKDKVEFAKQEYLSILGKSFHYEFSDNEIKKIQTTINKLRKLITESPDLTEEHKNRLLIRLEKLQSELHKKMSNLDRFTGFFLDMSIVIGQVGENAKPIIDCVKKIKDILSPIISDAHGLPSGFKLPLLESKKEEES